MLGRFLQGSGEHLILDEGRVNKFNKRFATIGAFGQVAPASVGGDKKLEYKVSSPCMLSTSLAYSDCVVLRGVLQLNFAGILKLISCLAAKLL